MYEELMLMKKIVEYFNKIKKIEIANIINEELEKEFQKAPDFQEPEYVKDDLTTIFFRHVTLKRRKSEASMRKSNANKTINSKKSKANPQASLFTVVNDENQEDVQIDNSSLDDLKETNHSILAPINTNRISEKIARKSQFLPEIISTPNNSTRSEKKEATLENVINSHDVRNYQNDEDSDSDSFVVCDPGENCHQKINFDPEELDNIYDISNFNNDYETFMRQSQLDVVSDNHSLGGNNVEFNCKDVNDSEEIVIVKDNVSFDNVEEIQRSEQISTGSVEESNYLDGTPLVNNSSEGSGVSLNIREDNNGKGNVDVETQIVHSNDINDEDFQCGQIPAVTQDSSNYSNLMQNSSSFQCGQVPPETQENDCSRVSQEMSPGFDCSNSLNSSSQIPKVTNEIAIQCDPFEFTDIDGSIKPQTYRKRSHSQDEEINKNTKKSKITENIIDLDDEVKELEDCEQNINVIDHHSANESLEYSISKKPNRTRNASLSSIDTLPDEINESKPPKSRKRAANKSTIIYKEDKKLDMQRRILLTDGWILWPKSLLSCCLKHYNEEGFIEVLGLEIDDVNNLTKKELLERLLENMYTENMISKIHHSSKKIDIYLKLSSLPDDVLECLDIPLQIYTDNLWNKSLGPKNGRKLCAEGAPEIVKDLLHLELDFVNNLL